MKLPLLHGENDDGDEHNEPLSIEEDIQGFMETLPPLDQLKSLNAKELSELCRSVKELSELCRSVTDALVKLESMGLPGIRLRSIRNLLLHFVKSKSAGLLGSAHINLSEPYKEFDAATIEKFRLINRQIDQYLFDIHSQIDQDLLDLSRRLNRINLTEFDGSPPKPSGQIEFPLQTPVSGSPGVRSEHLQNTTRGRVARVLKNSDENAPTVKKTVVGSKPQLMEAVAEKMEIGDVPTHVLDFTAEELNRGKDYLRDTLKKRLAKCGLDVEDCLFVTEGSLAGDEDDLLPRIKLDCFTLDYYFNSNLDDNDQKTFTGFEEEQFETKFLFYNRKDLIEHPRANSMSEVDDYSTVSEDLLEHGAVFLPYKVFLDVTPVARVSITLRNV